jgi:hypothetical protein
MDDSAGLASPRPMAAINTFGAVPILLLSSSVIVSSIRLKSSSIA